jgi:hypothetical protein
MPQIPMVFTFNESFSWQKNRFLDKWLISRIDSIFAFTQNMKQLAAETFPISERKIHVTGAGIDFPEKMLFSQHGQEKTKIMLFISRTEEDLRNLKIFVDSIPPLFHQLESIDYHPKLIFTFLTDISWYVHPLFGDIKRMILERQLEMHISFETRPLAVTIFKDCDIFVGLPQLELFSDQDLYAMVSQIPVLLPRTSTHQELVRQGKFGETYHPEDGRELKSKLFKIITKYSSYLDHLQSIDCDLQDQHHFERYAKELYSSYEKLYTQRLRYSQKQKKLA